jgi:glycosyltransferase involved in cell wall biosynthesis
MSRVLLVPDLPLERWPAMDRYANRLHDWLESTVPELEVRLAASIGELTREPRGRRRPFLRWWTQPLDPSRIVLPGPLRKPQQYAARYAFYPLRLRRESRRADLVHILDHSYAHLRLAARRTPAVVTVHDLMPVIELRSEQEGWEARLRHRALRRSLRALRKAERYIVGTAWLKGELATWLGDDARIRVVPFGVDRSFFVESPGARERQRERWHIPLDAFVVLHVGSTVERKNVPLVIETLARLRGESDAHLLQVGGRLTGAQDDMARRLGVRPYVRVVPSADETTLRRAYRAADVLLFPSLYEGFGYPVLEAFASGLPVVTSGAGGLKEVGGDATVVVERRDAGAFVEAIRALGEDEDRRDLLIERGRIRARQFNWQTTAEKTADVYKELL